MISRVSLCLMAVLLWSADFAAAQCSGWGAGPSKVSDLSKTCSWALGGHKGGAKV